MTFGYGLRYCGIVNVFPHVEGAGDRQVINHEEEKPRARLGPLGHSRWLLYPTGRASLCEFDSVGSVWKKVDNPIDDTIITWPVSILWLRCYDLFQKLWGNRKGIHAPSSRRFFFCNLLVLAPLPSAASSHLCTILISGSASTAEEPDILPNWLG